MPSLDRAKTNLVSSLLLKAFQHEKTRRWLLGLTIWLVITLLLVLDLLPDRLSLQEGQVSPKDIIAPRTIEFVDQEKTKKREEEVKQTIPPVFTFDPTVVTQVENQLTDFFLKVRQIQGEPGTEPAQRVAKLREGLGFSLSQQAAEVFLNASDDALREMEEASKQTTKKVMQPGLKAENLGAAQADAVREVSELLGSQALALAAGELTKGIIRPNLVYNEQETKKKLQQAAAQIDPVKVIVKKGQVIVRRGDQVTREQLTLLEALRLQHIQVDFLGILGMGLLVFIFMAMVLLFLRQFRRDIYERELFLALIGLVVAITIILTKTVSIFSGYLAPVAYGTLLIAILLDSRLAILIGGLLSIATGIVTNSELRFTILAMVGGLASVYGISRVSQRSDLMRAGLLISVANLVTIYALGLLFSNSPVEVLFDGAFGIINGVASAVLTIGSLPFLESTFKITTPIRLLELSNPNQPLLRKLLLEAPGTYHHSVIVGNLAEAGAEAIGAESLLVRVGAYYHDIGKIRRPYFFVENQITCDNPHDQMSPALSTLIITSHIKHGVELAREYKIPEPIVEIIRQHHGTSLVSYFYHRANEDTGNGPVSEKDFRYDGPKPQTKEAALVMLADAVEAAVRSLVRPTSEQIEELVRKIVRERLQDGQLDDAGLTLKELEAINLAFIKTLTGIFHNRIEYPEQSLQEQGQVERTQEGRNDEDGSSVQ